MKSLISFLRNFSARKLCKVSLQGIIDFNKLFTGQQKTVLLWSEKKKKTEKRERKQNKKISKRAVNRSNTSSYPENWAGRRERSPSCVFSIIYLSHSLWFQSILPALISFSFFKSGNIQLRIVMPKKVKFVHQVPCFLEEQCKENRFLFICFPFKTAWVIGFKLPYCFLFWN